MLISPPPLIDVRQRRVRTVKEEEEEEETESLRGVCMMEDRMIRRGEKCVLAGEGGRIEGGSARGK